MSPLMFHHEVHTVVAVMASVRYALGDARHKCMLDGHLPHAGHVLSQTANKHAASVARLSPVSSSQVLAHIVHQRCCGNLKAMWVGTLRQKVECFCWFQRQHLR